MKEFQMSSPKERAAGTAFTVAVLPVFAALLWAVRSNVGLLIFCGLSAVLVCGLLLLYVAAVHKAACVWNPETKVLKILGIPGYEVDLSQAVLLQTLPRKNGQVTTRVMVFSDRDEQIVATVSTFFTFRQGLMTDPLARELAAEMGIAFQENVPAWEFDKKLYQEHMKEVEAQEKLEAKERRKARMQHRIEKRKKDLSK